MSIGEEKLGLQVSHLPLEFPLIREDLKIYVVELLAGIERHLKNLIKVVGHIFHVLWQLVQFEIRLLGEVGHDHLVVAFTSTVDLKEFAWVGVTQLPRLDTVVALARRRLVVQDEQVSVKEWIHRLLLVLEI